VHLFSDMIDCVSRQTEFHLCFDLRCYVKQDRLGATNLRANR
jgi:hypothetical protein